MIDIHSHILFGLDDGAKDLQESLALLKLAESDGITHIVTTPHIHLRRFDNTIEAIFHRLDELKAAIQYENLNIKLAAAAEVRLDITLIPLIKSGKLPFIGFRAGMPCILLELPHSHVPTGYDNFIKWLDKQGIKVIIAHPERNRDIQVSPFYIERLRKLDCQFQITASSLEGEWGNTAKKISEDMLTAGVVDYIASDAHSIKRRPPILSRAKNIVNELIGEHKADLLFVNNPMSLTESLFSE